MNKLLYGFSITFIFLVLAFAGTTSALGQFQTPPPAFQQTRAAMMSNSGANGKFIFGILASPTGNWQLAVVGITGQRFTFFSRDDLYRSEPSFAPDGLRFVYTRWKDSKPEIWWMDANERRENGPLAKGYVPGWSPDGTQIAFLNENSVLSVMNADGTNQRSLKQGFGSGSRPAWSPDSRFIVVGGQSATDTMHGISILAPDGTIIRQIYQGDTLHPGWSADGTYITFQAVPDYKSAPESTPAESLPQVFRIAPDGKDLRQLTTNGGSYPMPSPNGRKVAYFNKGSIYIMNADGTLPFLVTQTIASVQYLVWVP